MPREASLIWRARRKRGSASPGAVGGLEEQGEVVEVYGDRGVVLAEGGLVDLEGAVVEGLGLPGAVGVLEEQGEVVEVCGDLGVVLVEEASSIWRARR